MAHITNRTNSIDWNSLRIARGDVRQREINAANRICARVSLDMHKAAIAADKLKRDDTL